MAYSCVDIGVNLIGEGDADRRNALDVVKRGMDIAAGLDCPNVLLAGSKPAEGMSNEEGRKVLAEALARAAELAEGTGVTVTIEDYGVYPEFTCSAAHVREVLDLSGRDDLKVTFDNGNFLFADERPADCLSVLGDRTVHVHIKDFVRGDPAEPGGLRSPSGIKYVGCDIGEGEAQVAECLAGLKADGYDGWLSLEVGTSPPLRGAIVGARYVQDAWERA
ncbi:MAG: sugar phosphate isomerase/epimerase family protein, partial [Armatimonadota bacterium]